MDKHKGPIDTYMHVVTSKSKLGPYLFGRSMLVLPCQCWQYNPSDEKSRLTLKEQKELKSRGSNLISYFNLFTHISFFIQFICTYIYITSNFYMQQQNSRHMLDKIDICGFLSLGTIAMSILLGCVIRVCNMRMSTLVAMVVSLKI